MGITGTVIEQTTLALLVVVLGTENVFYEPILSKTLEFRVIIFFYTHTLL